MRKKVEIVERFEIERDTLQVSYEAKSTTFWTYNAKGKFNGKRGPEWRTLHSEETSIDLIWSIELDGTKLYPTFIGDMAYEEKE